MAKPAMKARDEVTEQSEAAPPDARQVAVRPPSGVPSELADEMEGLAGAGTSARADDNIIPFLRLLQDMNPEVKRRESAYVEGAEPGCLLNKATRQLWKPQDQGLLVDANDYPLEVQPCAFNREIVEWVPRAAGGGFVARYPLDELTPEATMKKIGGRQVVDPKDPKRQKKVWVLGENDLVDTRYHFVNIVHRDGRLSAAVLSFSSTGHQTSRSWNSMMREQFLDGNVAPSWFKRYHVRAVERSNNVGNWFVLEFVDPGLAGWIVETYKDPKTGADVPNLPNAARVRAAGLALHKSVAAGTVRAADDAEPSAGDASPAADVI